MPFTVLNLTRNVLLAAKAERADTFLARMRGLLGRKGLGKGEALVISHCNSIHMFFMTFPIDVVFVNRQGRVVGLVENIPPFGLSPVFWKASFALELPAGTISATRTSLRDQIKTGTH